MLCSREPLYIAGSLDFKNQGVKWEAKGTAFVTNQRVSSYCIAKLSSPRAQVSHCPSSLQVLFLRQPPLPAPAEGTAPSAHLRSLSVPLASFVDTRYM